MIKKLFPLLVVFAILSFNPIAIAENEDFVIEITKPRLIFPFTGLDVAPGEKKPIYQCYINVVSGKGNITSLSLDIQGSILGLFSNLKIEWPRGEIFENSGPVNLGTNDFKGTAYLEQGDDFNLFLTADVQKPTNDQLLENGINTSILSFESIQTSEPCSVLGDFPIDLMAFLSFWEITISNDSPVSSEVGEEQKIFKFNIAHKGGQSSIFYFAPPPEEIRLWFDKPVDGLSNLSLYYYDTYSDQERFLDNIPGPVISEYNIFYPSFGIIPIHDNWIMIIKADIEKRAGPTICTGFLENTDIKLYSFGESHCIIGDFPMLSYIKITNAQPAVNLYLNQEIFHPGDIMQVDAEVKNPRINTLNAVLHLYLIKKKVVHVKSVVIAVSLETILSITILEHQIQSKNTGNYAWLILLSNENGFLDYDLATFTFEKPD